MPNIRRSRESWNRSSSFLYDHNINGGGNHGENIVWSFVAECAPEAPRKIEKALEIVRRRTSSDSFRVRVFFNVASRILDTSIKMCPFPSLARPFYVPTGVFGASDDFTLSAYKIRQNFFILGPN